MDDARTAAARRRFASARVARLATVDAAGRPHLVPLVFAVGDGAGAGPDRLYSAVDAKPKRTTALRRLANIAAHPEVSLLVDHYDDEDWSALWWVRADGTARVAPAGSADDRLGRSLLVERYPQYRAEPPTGPLVVVEVVRWVAWSAR